MSERPAAAQRVSSDPPESVNQAAAQPVPTRPDEAAPGSGNTARTDPQSPTLAGAGLRSAAPGTPTSGRAPGGLPVTEAGGEVYFELKLSDAWVWDMYRPARFVRNVRVLTFKDVNVEELDKPDLELPDGPRLG
jgi:hypothetical protein